MVNTEHQSKYFEKHFVVEYPHLMETQCPRSNCRGIFAVDYSWLRYQIRDDGDFALIACPYCHKVFKEAV